MLPVGDDVVGPLSTLKQLFHLDLSKSRVTGNGHACLGGDPSAV